MRSVIIATGLILIYAFTAFAQAPQVVSVTPTQNEVSAVLTADITATFDIDMDPVTIDNSTFSVYSRTYGYLAGTVSYDQPTRTATFDPTRDFFHGDVITATLTAGIGSLGGTPMDRGFSWTFTVIAGGTGTFGAFAEYPVWGSQGHYSVFVSDLNMDDYPDIIAGQISVFLNNGDGTFPTRQDYPNLDWTRSIYTGDLDRDGDIDISSVTTGAYNEIVLRFNNGNGTFGSPTRIEVGHDVGHDAYAISAVDVENDADLDLVVGGRDSLINFCVFVYKNDGSGNFALDSSYTIIHHPDAVYTGDFDNDGDADIATTCNGLTVFYNDGEGIFSGPFYFPGAGDTQSITGADFNSDSFLDLAVAALTDQIMWIMINDGYGSFDTVYNYSTDSRFLNLCAADLNGDQSLDLPMVSVKHDSDFNTFLFYNNGDGSMTLNSSLNVTNSSRCYDIFASDLDLDGDMDLVDYTSSAHSITIMKDVLTCGYVTGDVNGSGSYNGLDIVYSVSFFKGGDPPVYDECDCPVGGYWYRQRQLQL
jgi:hypothetical protein